MASAMPNQPTIDLRRYGDILVARWRVIVAATLLGLLISVGYLLVAPSSFVSTTTVAVSAITTDPYAANRNSSNLIDMSAEAVTASSFKVAQIAADETHGEWDATRLRQATTTTAGADSTTMSIAVSASTEKRARSGAAAMADAYLQARSDQAANSIDSVLDRDRERIGEHREQLIDALQRLAAAEPQSSAAAEAAADQQTLSLQISALLARISSLEGIDTTGGVVLNPASMTAVTVKPSRSLVLITGLAVGLGAGIIAAFVTHTRRKRISTPRDLSRELQVETLGSLESRRDGVVTENSGLLNLAQRMLRMAATRDARVIAVVNDVSVPHASALADSISAAIRESGASSAVAPGVNSLSHAVGDLVILPIASDASTAARLHALRVSDVVVVVVGAGLSRYRDLSVLLMEADEMGTPVAGAVLLSKAAASPQVRRTRKHQRREKNATTDSLTPEDAVLGQRDGASSAAR